MHGTILWNWRAHRELKSSQGTGGLDYGTYLRDVESLPQDTPLLIEHLKTAEEYDLAREYIFSVGKETGVDL